MANYLEEVVEGIIWHRFNKIIIDNPYGVPPLFRCSEQEAVLVDGRYMETDAGTLSFTYDPAQVIMLYDPDTVLPTGTTVLGSEMRKYIFSYIMAAILIRDAPIGALDFEEASDTMASDASVIVALDDNPFVDKETSDALSSDGTVV